MIKAVNPAILKWARERSGLSLDDLARLTKRTPNELKKWEKFFSKNLVSVIAHITKKDILKKSETLKFVHQINFTQALSKSKNTIVLLFKRSMEKVFTIVEQLRTIFIQTTEEVRPNRKYPRRHRVKQKRFYHEYRTTC